MNPDTWILLSGALTFGVPLALAARELWVLRRDGRGPPGPDRAPDAPSRPTPPGPAWAGPLPECLIPELAPSPAVRPRVLEDA